jgi:cation diffusion facilitator family transporter
MHSHTVSRWQHSHAFLGEGHQHHERRVWLVVGLTVAMMVGEIVGGAIFGSMALVADGWHMATHAAALGIAGLAYLFARRHLHDARFSLGTGKFGDLAAFASAIILGMIAFAIAYESIQRLMHPVAIRFTEAIAIAVLGLAVNLASAWLLRADHDHDHHHAHEHSDHHGHEHSQHHHHDHNLRAAYVHVLADALTSVLAIGGLTAALLFGWPWIDPAVALVGTGVILSWSVGLIRSSGAILVDSIPDPKLAELIRQRIEVDGDKVADLHLWQVGPGHTAVIVAVVCDKPQSPSFYKQRLDDIPGLSHVTIEVHPCEG